MPRNVYRDPFVEKELEKILMDLKQIRKHQYEHFRLHVLIELEAAIEHIEIAIKETQLSPKHVEELGGGK